MAKKASIGAGIALDGEKEFRSAVSNINNDMKVLASELKKVSSEFLGNKGSVEALTAKDEVLNKQLEAQKEKVDAIRKALENSEKQYGENDKKTKDWQISLNNAESDLNKLNKEIDDNKDALMKAQDPAEELGEDIKEVGENADKAGDSALSMGDIIKANLISDFIIGGVKSLASAFTSLASGFLDTSKESAAYADDILTMATVTGMSTESLQAYNYAAGLVDVSMETLTGSMAKNIKSMDNARNGSEKYAEAYKKLGIDITDANGNLLDSEDVYWKTIDALGKMEEGADRDALSMQLFGKSAQDLNPLIAQGSEGIAELTKEAKDMGAVLSDESLAGLGAFDDALQRIDGSSNAMKNTLGSLLAPAFADIAESAAGYMAEFTKSIQGANGDVNEIGTIIGETLSKVVERIGESLPEIVNGAISVIKSFAGGLSDNLDSIVSIGADIVQTIITAFLDMLPDIVKMGLDLILSLANGITGNLSELIPIIVDVVLNIVDTLIDNLDMLIDAAIEMILALAEGLIDALPELIDKVPIIIEKLVMAISNNLPKLLEAGITLIIELAKGLITAIPNLIKAVPDVVTAIIKAIVNYYSNILKIGENIVSKLSEGIEGMANWISAKTKVFSKGVVTALSNGITGLAEIGLNLVKGLWNGIDNATDWIIGKIKGFGGSVVNGIKDFFGIHSPSTVFRDEVGRYLAQGLGEGFTDEMKGVTADISKSIPTDFNMEGSYNLAGQYLDDNKLNLTNGNGIDYGKLTDIFINALNMFKPQVILNHEKVGEFVLDTVNKEVFA